MACDQVRVNAWNTKQVNDRKKTRNKEKEKKEK